MYKTKKYQTFMTCTGHRKKGDHGLQNIHFYNIKNIPHLFIHITY